MAQLRPALSLRHVRFAATATGGSMTIMRAHSGRSLSVAGTAGPGSIKAFIAPFTDDRRGRSSREQVWTQLTTALLLGKQQAKT
ncbi:hypothetical protein I6F07_07775 [Ensifer sp. IC4062]|nr:hypothetical protein [Ensifer sp. IC4062]MCA1440124.1 hypothetical protein [Ensifer sp. IC4062]